MKYLCKKIISLFLCFTIFFSFAVSGYALEKNNSYIEELKNNTVVLEDNEIILKVLLEFENGKCIATLDKDTNDIVVETLEKFDGKENNQVYEAKLDYFEEDKISGVLINKETDEVYPIGENQNTSKRKKRFIWALPIAEEVAVLLAALAGAAVAGKTIHIESSNEETEWYSHGAIKSYMNTKRNKQYKHFSAIIKNGVVYVGPPLTDKAAGAAVAAGLDVFSSHKSYAQSLAQKCGGIERGPEIHGTKRPPNYYLHFHCKLNKESHIFFL
ncbi:hypothetical protein [Tepidibacter mesophilus]|uniref:hypothetical protein n=1 Tax=Tepidibacter mesophilus TaxID=655607 RepID=UPI000C0703FB|nr:hypothetical protein [Tepidibacter mesophilus]